MLSESEIIRLEFPKAKFGICFSINELNDVVIDNHIAFIKVSHNYPVREPCDKIFMCKNLSGESIKIRDLINCLIENKYRHNVYEWRWLERFYVDDDGVVVPFFGS